MSYENENPATHEPGAAGLPQDSGAAECASLSIVHNSAAMPVQVEIEYIPGLLGEIRHFIYNAAPHANKDIALAGAIALLAGITGKAYNTYTGAGLNQYILLLASTGMGKEAAASGISRLLSAVSATVPAANDFKGPALVSSAGLLKWLEKKPSIVCVIGEFGYRLKAMSSPKASPNDEMLKATLLDGYSKSGAGNVLDPMAYSDRDKQTGAILSPNICLLGESVPGIVYEALNDNMILSGLLPRFMVIEAGGQRAPLNETPKAKPDDMLVQRLADLCGYCLSLNHNNNVHIVDATDEAKAKFREFSQWVTDQINSQTSEVQRELWNRAYLKALKLATLCAVGINHLAPIVTIDEAMWATRLIVSQTEALAAKFSSGEVGVEGGNEDKQVRRLRAVIREYVKAAIGKYHNSACTDEMHRDHIFSHKYLYNRLVKLPTFAEDKAGATRALERAVRHLEEGDEIRRVNTGDMLKHYGKATKSYGITNENEFMKGGD